MIAEYERGVAYAQSKNFQLWLGIEVTIDDPHYSDWLLYGVTKEFLQQTPCLYNLTQEALFRLCEEHGVLMVQAHPFREEQGYDLADLKFMHGVEIYNSHRMFNPQFERITAIAEENDKIKTSGGDFHEAETYLMAGMIVPDEINDQFMLRDYLKTGESIIFNSEKIIYKK